MHADVWAKTIPSEGLACAKALRWSMATLFKKQKGVSFCVAKGVWWQNSRDKIRELAGVRSCSACKSEQGLRFCSEWKSMLPNQKSSSQISYFPSWLCLLWWECMAEGQGETRMRLEAISVIRCEMIVMQMRVITNKGGRYFSGRDGRIHCWIG